MIGTAGGIVAQCVGGLRDPVELAYSVKLPHYRNMMSATSIGSLYTFQCSFFVPEDDAIRAVYSLDSMSYCVPFGQSLQFNIEHRVDVPAREYQSANCRKCVTERVGVSQVVRQVNEPNGCVDLYVCQSVAEVGQNPF